MQLKDYKKENLIRYTKELKKHFAKKSDIEDLLSKRILINHLDMNAVGDLTFNGRVVGVPSFQYATEEQITNIVNGTYTSDLDYNPNENPNYNTEDSISDEEVEDILDDLYT